jgi:hypothetical protein
MSEQGASLQRAWLDEVDAKKIPVVQRTGEVLQTEQGSSESATDSTVRVGFVLHAEELGRGGCCAGGCCGRHSDLLSERTLSLTSHRGSRRRGWRSRLLRDRLERATNRFADSFASTFAIRNARILVPVA